MISIPGPIPIRISPFFWFLIVMIGWLNTATLPGTVIWAAVILVSVLVHEFGHALTAILFGQRAEINLEGLGGLTKRHGPTLARWQEFLIVLNGPLAGLILFAFAYECIGMAREKNAVIFYALEVAVNVNLFWTILNLLPVLPLDGGHLLRIVLEWAWGMRGLRAAFLMSIILGALLGFFFFLVQQMLMGALFLMLAFESYRAWADLRGAAPQDEDLKLQNSVREGVEALKQGRRQEALSKFTFVRGEAPKGILYVTATQYGARVLAEQGHYKQAYDWLFPVQNRLSAEYVRLLQQLAYRVEEWGETAKIGQKAYQQEPSLEVALLNALSYAVMGEAEPAVGWLRCAMQLGLPDIRTVIAKREFDTIRGSAAFQNWLTHLPSR